MRKTMTLTAIPFVVLLACQAFAQTNHSAHMATDAESHGSLEGANVHGINIAFLVVYTQVGLGMVTGTHDKLFFSNFSIRSSNLFIA